MKRQFVAILLTLFTCLAGPVTAHEVRPAYLELRELPAGELDVLWKTPMRGEMRLALAPVLSGAAEELTPMTTRRAGNAAVQTWRLRLLEPLRGRSLHVDGLNATMTDALVRIEFADGTNWVARLTPQVPELTIPEQQGGGAVAWTYLGLGVEHILLGVDHLLFVLALLLITRGTKRLVLTITAFTVAHSVTLALATLGFVQVPPPPVEAVIALSIVFVAAEVLHAQQGNAGLTARAPWIVAFIFGLLHGFGFAGALSEIGLPQGQIPLALLFFNVGVEAGQLLFVGAVIPVMMLWRRSRATVPGWAGQLAPYAIGSIAMFWVIERIAGFA
ncbi:MAG: HupE/UreJ family protein [Steroidobacteraceae bacterium]